MLCEDLTLIGGGTGLSNSLWHILQLGSKPSAIVAMTDGGGNTSFYRYHYGLPALTDALRCAHALIGPNASKLLKTAWDRRAADKGEITGQRVCNFLFAEVFEALITEGMDSESALRQCFVFAHQDLDVQGRVIPVTYSGNANIRAVYASGHVIEGEDAIGHPPIYMTSPRIKKLEISGDVTVNTEAIIQIMNSKTICIAPGSLFTSTGAVAVIPGIKDAVRASKAKLIWVAPFMTQWGETNDLTLGDMFEILQDMFGRQIDTCLVNNDVNYPASILRSYRDEKSDIPINDLNQRFPKLELVEGAFWDQNFAVQNRADMIWRGPLRHNRYALEVLCRLST